MSPRRHKQCNYRSSNRARKGMTTNSTRTQGASHTCTHIPRPSQYHKINMKTGTPPIERQTSHSGGQIPLKTRNEQVKVLPEKAKQHESIANKWLSDWTQSKQSKRRDLQHQHENFWSRFQTTVKRKKKFCQKKAQFKSTFFTRLSRALAIRTKAKLWWS